MATSRPEGCVARDCGATRVIAFDDVGQEAPAEIVLCDVQGVTRRACTRLALEPSRGIAFACLLAALSAEGLQTVVEQSAGVHFARDYAVAAQHLPLQRVRGLLHCVFVAESVLASDHLHLPRFAVHSTAMVEPAVVHR